MIVKEKIIMELDMVVTNSVSTNMDFYYLKRKKMIKIANKQFWNNLFNELETTPDEEFERIVRENNKVDYDEFYRDIFSQLENELNKEDNMKLKVGDSVKVLCGGTEPFSKYVGTIHKIKEISMDGVIYLDGVDKLVEYSNGLKLNVFYREDELVLVEDNNAVNHPSHYQGKIEVIDFIEDHNLNFNRGNAVKYISRAGKKYINKDVEDLEKAVWYLKHEIERVKIIE